MHDKFEKAKYVKREVRRARWLTARVVAERLDAECHVINLSRHGANLGD